MGDDDAGRLLEGVAPFIHIEGRPDAKTKPSRTGAQTDRPGNGVVREAGGCGVPRADPPDAKTRAVAQRRHDSTSSRTSRDTAGQMNATTIHSDQLASELPAALVVATGSAGRGRGARALRRATAEEAAVAREAEEHLRDHAEGVEVGAHVGPPTRRSIHTADLRHSPVPSRPGTHGSAPELPINQSKIGRWSSTARRSQRTSSSRRMSASSARALQASRSRSS